MTATVISASSWGLLIEEAAREVFQIMLGSGLQPEAEITDTGANVSAVIGFAGQLRGLLTVRCNRSSALAIAAHMLGVTPAAAENELNDALGELCNMIAGGFKNKLEQQGVECLISIPTVVAGSDYKLHTLVSGLPIELYARFEGGALAISFQIQP